ncbi:MAG: aldo/keto reductase [Clostridia bacterium]|nr:aldo/keto reductase [Clostridia bacterium]
MKYIKLGNSDLTVSRICVGGMSFGKASSDFHEWTLDEFDTNTMVKHALDLGINFFDTANQYSHGTSEEYLGKALKKNAKREDVIIATKVYFNEGMLSKSAINREVEQSLKRLDTDYIDLYIIHRFDYSTPIEETMQALDNLVKSGKVRALGASAMYGYQFHNMQICAEKNGFTKFVSMQNHYNLLYREDERELIPICNQYGVSLTPYSPLAAGRLSRLDWHSDSKRSLTDKVAKRKYDDTQKKDFEIVKQVYNLSQKYNASMSQIAIAWQYAKGVASPIVGATKTKYFDDVIKAVNIKLSAEDIENLEKFYIPHKISGAR